MRVLVLGGGAREHAIALALRQAEAEVAVASPNTNPGLEAIARESRRIDPTLPEPVVAFAKQSKMDLVVVGPEAPLAAGVADALRAQGIPVVGPSVAGARLETSKPYCRELLTKYGLDVSPKHVVVREADRLTAAVAEIGGPFVVKPAGLTSGKGVRVQGLDFVPDEVGMAYAKQLLDSGPGEVVLEERLEGEEFSLMAFVTDSGVFPMPAVQDYKRALEGDLGGNTGGMGSYSQRDHLLPFLAGSARDAALDVLKRTVEALRQEGISYRGVLYGGFMLTRRGPVLLEFNARFGDPEAINVLTLYEEGDFAELLRGVAEGRVDPNLVRFRLRATVVKYLVPPGYGSKPTAGGILKVDEPAISALGVHVLYGNVDRVGGYGLRLTSSRAVALVGEASAIHEAGIRVESALAHVEGDYYVRHDIGTKADLSKRTEHMRQLLVPGAKPSPLPLSVAPPGAPPSSAASASQVI